MFQLAIQTTILVGIGFLILVFLSILKSGTPDLKDSVPDCPVCDLPLHIGKNGVKTLICRRCGTITTWDLNDHPPTLIDWTIPGDPDTDQS